MTDVRDDRDSELPLAAEYVLGLLEGQDLAEARSRSASDADFARDVARWRGCFASLHDQVDDVAPPSGLWAQVEAATRSTWIANDNPRSGGRAVTAWKAATALMTAVAASLALALVFQPRPRPQSLPQTSAPLPASEPMVALVGGQKAPTTLMVSWDRATRQLVLATAGPLPPDASHSHQLWVIPAGGKPHSLGLLPAGKMSHRQLADAIADLLQQGATIAISVEPRGGSPTGAPTGPVVATGALSRT